MFAAFRVKRAAILVTCFEINATAFMSKILAKYYITQNPIVFYPFQSLVQLI